MTEISLITKEDLPFIRVLEEKLFSDPWNENSLFSWLSCSGAKGYVLKVDGVRASYALFQTICGEGELLRCGVEPQFSRKGLTFTLLSFALEKEKNEGAKRIFLEVRKNNLPAKNLYEKLGFRLLGERKNYYHKPTDDALIYEKIL